MLLAMDTATQAASIAVCDWQDPAQAPRLLAECTWLARRRQTQDLLATVQSLLTLVDLTPRDLTGLAVTTGPGSFTGVRIAVSAAKGIGLGLPHPVAAIGLPVLSVTAAPWLAPAASAGAQVWAYLQAGRGRLNWCRFVQSDIGRDARMWRPGAADHEAGEVETLVAALAHATEPVWLVGEETMQVRAAVARLDHVTALDAISGARRAGHLARLAARHFHHNAAQVNDDELAALQPLYLNAL